MPRDELDGIKTKRGRVVYDREKRPMTARDLARITAAVSARGAVGEPLPGSGFGGGGVTRDFSSDVVDLLVKAVLSLDFGFSFAEESAERELRDRISVIIEEHSTPTVEGGVS